MKYKRVLLKLSGESLGPETGGISEQGLEAIASEIKEGAASGTQIAVVVGGGNLWRGAGKWLDRVKADYMGMLATLMNAMALREMLVTKGIPSKVLSALEAPRVAELYSSEKAVEYMKDGAIVILAGGTGNPYFTTDTTAALRAAEIKAEIVLKATQVDGVYDDDPRKNKAAKKYPAVSFDEAIRKNLKIMDSAAFALCRDNNIPIIVFDFYRKGNLAKVIAGGDIGTKVSG